MAKRLFLALLFVVTTNIVWAQTPDSTDFSIYYSSPQEYVIGGIEIIGIKYLDKDMLKQYSGLNEGDEIQIPGEKITSAIRKYWHQGLFSDVKIYATKVIGRKIYLTVELRERPRLSKINYFGVKKGEKEDIEKKVLLLEGSQIVDSHISTAKRLILQIFNEKGFYNTEVNIIQRDDPQKENAVILDVTIDKKEKIKVNKVIVNGNVNLSSGKIEHAMKKTNARNLRNIVRSKKFLEDKYTEDKKLVIDKYNELGYRDARIMKDSIIKDTANNKVNIELWVEEGNKYFIRNISWVGNTIYPTAYLEAYLGIKKGDIYNQKQLDKRLSSDPDAVSSLYNDNGYLFFQLTPVEINIEGDSIDLEMRMYEGRQATLSRVNISGNTKTHENVARRELYTKPGDLYSKSNIMRSYRQLAQLGHFDPEHIVPDVTPHVEDGTVDVSYQLTEKANDQIEISGGWGMGMFIGSVGLKFSNFSIYNVFDKSSWRPLPSGDGQTLSLRMQTNGKYYQQYSFSFMEPWFGGKKPNSLSLSVFYSKLSQGNSTYNYNNPYSSYGSGYYGGYNPYGNDPYSSYGYGQNYMNSEPTSFQITYGTSLGYGYRLNWPDDYFTVYHELSLQHYHLKNWYYYFLSSGHINSLSLKTTFSRNSIDNPLYSRRGSSFGLSAELTPPYSLINNKDYGDKSMTEKERYNFLEYHKWTFNAKWFTPIDKAEKLVVHAKYDFGLLGYYNKNRRSPLQGYKMGGDGMSGYDIYGSDNIGMRGYANNSLTPSAGGNIYSKATLELRYPITLSESANIYVISFLEGGNCWYDYKTLNVFDLKRSAGVGVRFWLPMFGMLGVDWGYGFDPVGGSYNSSKSQFHFIIGQQF